MAITECDLAVRVGRPGCANTPDRVVHHDRRNTSESFTLVADLTINADSAGYLVPKAVLDAFLVRSVQDASAVAGAAGSHHHVAIRSEFLKNRLGYEITRAIGVYGQV